MQKLFTLFLSVFVLASCATDQTANSDATSATVSGKIDHATDTIELYRIPMIGDGIDASKVGLAEDGTFELTVDVVEPGEYRLRNGRNRATLYLHPGDALTVSADAEDINGTMLYQGKGAKVNNYIGELKRRLDVFNATIADENIYKLEQESFLERNNTMKTYLTDLYEKRFGDGSATPQFAKYAQTDIAARWANQLDNFPTYHAYYAKKDDFEVEDFYYAYRKEISLDDTEALASPQYRNYVRGHASNSVEAILEADETLEDDWAAVSRAQYQFTSSDPEIGDGVRDFLLGSNLYDYISYYGTDGAEEMIASYRETNKNPEFLSAVEENYTQWAKLAKGQDAPQFKYESIDGEEVALSDFRGKVVYVDVWATWCGPCKGEIPASKELKKKFVDNKDVVFMYISVDDKKEAWEKFLQDDQEWAGVHLITGVGWGSEITEEYMIKGIPRYILVDRDGKIANASAPRPSSGEKIEGLIRDLLGDDDQSDD
jgi:thiol-disulfide isomerase/thioredoxin